MTTKKMISDYTEEEFLIFAKKICNADYPTEEDADAAIREFIRLTEHPDGTDIIFYPTEEQEDSPEGLVKYVKEWRSKNNKPGFRQG